MAKKIKADELIEKLKDSLAWAIGELGDGYNLEEGETPMHGCEYVYNPEKGHCDWHERFSVAMELAGLLEDENEQGSL